jgi:GDP/UDP-N,N'-diacetylbacillosamine 2-epimerase (hydrolysing)
MMDKDRTICVVTGSRAEYGLLYWLIKRIELTYGVNLQIIVTGMHLSPEFGLTYKHIEQDGYNIDKKIEILLSSDSEVGISKSMGLGMISFSEAFDELKPDLLVVLGDRFEIFTAASAATVAKIPIAHLHGGETTEGAFDESFRHAITKMSHLHFTATERYRKRVIQLGEHPDRVFNVGAIGVYNINKFKILSKKEFEKSIDFKLGKKNLLVTFHPVTLEKSTAAEQFKNLLTALEKLHETNIIFTKSNADTGGNIINKMIDQYVKEHLKTTISFVSLGQLRYLTAIKYVDGVVGNSSSGLIEAPSLKTGTIDIGDRQRGRIKPDSVISCLPTLKDITRALNELFSSEFRQSVEKIVNPYGKTDTVESIFTKLQNFPLNEILKKKFYDLSD